MGATNVSFGQLPMLVLSAIQSYAGATFISNIERGELQGQTVYQASFTFCGRPVNLRILEDGSLVRDQANDLSLVESQSGSSSPENPAKPPQP